MMPKSFHTAVLSLAVLLLCFLNTACSQSAIAVSEFSAGFSGWKFAGRNLHDESVSESTLSIEDDGDELWYFSAPASFIGDKSAAFRGTLSYSIGHFLSNALDRPPLDSDDILLSCDSSDMTLGISGLVPHWSMDAYVTVHLDDRAPWRDIRTGRLAANADIQACLSALDALLLRGSFYAGPERTFLKNVTLTALHVMSSVERSSSSASVNPISHPSSVQSSGHDTNVLQLLESQAMSQLRAQLQQATEAASKTELQLQGLTLDLNQARAEVLRLLQVEQKSQSDTSICTHTLAQCESSLAESRAANTHAMDRLHQADNMRIRKQLELETNKGACVPAAEVQIIEGNLQTVVESLRHTNETLSAATTHALNVTQQLRDCNDRAGAADLRLRAAVEGADAIMHVVNGLRETLVAVERSYNNSIAAAVRDAAACNVALHAAHNRGIITVFLTYIGPCSLAPAAMFILMTCSSASAPPGRMWLLVSKLLLFSAYTSWVLPHVLAPSFFSSEASPAHASRTGLWPETLHELFGTHVPSYFLAYLPRSPAHFFMIGSFTFAFALAVQGFVVVRGPSPALLMDTIITWGTGFHFMFLHGWAGGASVDMSRGNEMTALYGAAFAMCALLHLFDRAGGNARDAGAEKTRGKYVSTKGDLLQAIKGRRDGSGSGRGYISSSDADGGMEEEGSSNDDYDQGQGKRGWKHPKRSTAPSSNLSSSLMGALALPPPAPLSMTSEEFVRDFLSKYPPAPKSFELTIGNKVRRLSKQFARDAPSLLLVDGAGMEDRPGCSEIQWIETVCQWILLHAGTHADTVFDVANQNLGIFCYEQVVRTFSKAGGVIVKQAGDHAIALDSDASSVVVSFASSFLLLDSGRVEGSQLKVSVTAVVNFGRKTAELIMSPATSMQQ